MIDLDGPVTTDRLHSALTDLLGRLETQEYGFVSPTPSTHRRVTSRLPRARRGDLRDVFGWGRPFEPDDLDPTLLTLLREARLLVEEGALFRSKVRVSTLDGRLHVHSARSGAQDAVFLGPDSYRFVRFLDALTGFPAQPSSISARARARARWRWPHGVRTPGSWPATSIPWP